MHLLDDVHLIKSEILVLPTASTFELFQSQSYQVMNTTILAVIVDGSRIRSHHWIEKIAQGCRRGGRGAWWGFSPPPSTF